MEFLSIPFFCCMFLAFILFYAKAERQWQRGVLLLSSCVFIGYYHIVYLIFAVAMSLVTFVWGRWLHRKAETKQAPYIFMGGLAVLAGTWLVSRYWLPVFPLGISFYTFQAISYLIEIYWGEDDEEDLLDFTLYMLLFMKFLSGPIERAQEFMPQFKKAHTFCYDKVVAGTKLLAWGAFMKLVVADRVATPLSTVFDSVREASGMQILQATLIYPIQLYADFAGYTNMAIGLALMLGFTLSPNFNRPFASTSTGELWRRWHMSLSFWVRDYIYMPLSASCRQWGKTGIYFALLVTFITIGVWHGAGWTFALYGLFQGVIIIYETAAHNMRERVRQWLPSWLWTTIMIARTYILFALSLLLFRIATLSDTLYAYRHMFDGINYSIKELQLGMADRYWIYFGIATVVMLVVEYIHHERCNLIDWTARQRPLVRWACYYVLLLLIFIYGAFGVDNFIYIQF
ncbi:MBOAT family protein [Prevotella sp. S7 MS 2]|uniref:MBOAT family O-acyltransferase n=1 Tax=Prevotella sp. S7 MS 2 TaxID=1287488 RepID=UPI000512E2FE|nr:MBOAT family O-acyltransferase [Prevotella sp. S7 MS 2]KGI60081.1 membrane protein [Prevotella sp. S7 MS 2]